MYLLIVFCLHGLAAWIAAGSERISYIGLQIALAFDLGVLKEYGPPSSIDPLRDRFIGIILSVCSISIVFSLVWPESAQSIAREKLAACLRAIASLLCLGGRKSSTPERERLELEIESRLSEANSYEEQATFESLILWITYYQWIPTGKPFYRRYRDLSCLSLVAAGANSREHDTPSWWKSSGIARSFRSVST
jgi:uncharacterized membrane protein YccC